MEINLFTGGKGGTGKTLMALCLSTHYLRTRRRTLLVDLNILNSDLFSILRKLRREDADHFREDGFSIVKVNNGEGLLVAPSAQEKRHYLLPNGIGGFYKDYLNKVFSLHAVKEFDPQVCLVDTGYHIANLAFPNDVLAIKEIWLENEQGEKDANYLKDHKLNIWFLWTLPTLLRFEEREAIERVLNQLERNHVGHFNSILNLRHVFNPYNLLTSDSLWDTISAIFRQSDDFEKWVNEADQKPDPPMSAIRVMKDISTRIRDVKRQGKFARDKYPGIVCEAIKRSHKRRPKNFFPVPPYEGYQNYTSDLINEPELSFELLQEFLEEAVILFDSYLNYYSDPSL